VILCPFVVPETQTAVSWPGGSRLDADCLLLCNALVFTAALLVACGFRTDADGKLDGSVPGQDL
jgi:hypothetical protein